MTAAILDVDVSAVDQPRSRCASAISVDSLPMQLAVGANPTNSGPQGGSPAVAGSQPIRAGDSSKVPTQP